MFCSCSKISLVAVVSVLLFIFLKIKYIFVKYVPKDLSRICLKICQVFVSVKILHPQIVKMTVALSKNSMPFESVLLPIFPIFPPKNIYSFEDRWIRINGSVDQWPRPCHFHVISLSFPSFPHFVSHTFFENFVVPPT